MRCQQPKCGGTLQFAGMSTVGGVAMGCYQCKACRLSEFVDIPKAPGAGTAWTNRKNGERYTVIGAGVHTETGEPLVAYIGASSGPMHFRPLAMWAAKFSEC